MYLAREVATDSGRKGEWFNDESENDISSNDSTEPRVESNRRTFLRAAGGGGAAFALTTGSLTSEAEAQEARAQNGGLKAYSGVLRVRTGRGFRGGEKWKAEIEFDNYPDEGDVLGPRGAVRVLQAEQAGGRGEFNVTPANLVTFRSPRIEDKARGDKENDFWNMDSRISRQRLEIWFQTNEINSRYREIVFITMSI